MNDLKNNGFDKSDLQNFKEDYKAVNNLITPKKEVVSKIKSMATISAKPKFKYAWVGGVASALVCAIFLITIAINFNSGDKIQNVDKLKHAENYKEIYRLIDNTIYKENTLDNFIDNLFGGAKKSDMNMTDGAMPESGAITEDMSEDTGAANNDFSDTNVQVKGVQESDIIKTDGEYIYTISKSKISIIKDDKVLSQITHRNKGEQAFEMYIYNDRLVVFYRVGDEPDIPITVHTDISADDIKIVTYDVSDKSAIKEIGAISQSGYYISSRMIDNYVYTVTEFYISWDFKKSNPITYIPKICGEVMDFSLIDLLPNIQSPKFTVVTAFDVNSPDEYSSKRAFLGGADQIYSSTTNMYLAKSKYVDDDYSYNATEVVKLSLTNGIINVEKNATIFGDIINQFAMDENNGYFRVVTNGYFHPNYKKTNDGVSKYNLNNLYILDEN
ncbi:MAG: beta-propeller domain-containing protein, partial [Oscillospiraceae bacterium]